MTLELNSGISFALTRTPGGIFDSRDKDGDGSIDNGAGGVSGGTSALAFSSTQPLADQVELTLTTNTYTFTAPEKSVWLGFGEGWLYSQSDGAPMEDVTVGSETLLYEFGSGSEERHVQTENGLKHLHSVMKPGGAGSPAGAGMIGWDMGSDLDNSSHVFAYSRVRCNSGTVSGASFQWKQERIKSGFGLSSPESGLSAGNLIYVTETGTPSGTWASIIQRCGDIEEDVVDDGQEIRLSTNTPRHNGQWHNFAICWRPNTVDLADGVHRTLHVQEGGSGIVIDEPENGSGDLADDRAVIRSSLPDRPDFVQVQDYIGNNIDGTGDIQIDRGDIYWQRGGTIFVLADNANPALASTFVPIRVNEVPNSQTAKLRLWKQSLADYSAAAVLVYENDGNTLTFVDGVSLGG